MGRPFDKHIDEQELNTLVPSRSNEGQRVYGPVSVSIREAAGHLASCRECRRKVAQYRQIVDRRHVGAFEIQAPQPDCPADMDWHEVAAGLWPELRTQQLITHAAQCAHCGALLRAAAPDGEPTAQEEEFLAQLKAPARPVLPARKEAAAAQPDLSIWRRFLDWKMFVPACALLVLIAVLSATRPSSSSPIAGIEFAQFAASTHAQHSQGRLALDFQSDSQKLLNEWLHGKPEFSLALPGSSRDSRQDLPYRIEGARMLEIRNKAAVYIAYRMEASPVSLIVTPVSAAIASGGVEAAFKKVSFHYYTIQNYKVVTWSVHGLSYALVSQEGNKTQRSCMVCHSAMRDRDLSNTPTPLADQNSIAEHFLQ